jgi:hypothetical protein
MKKIINKIDRFLRNPIVEVINALLMCVLIISLWKYIPITTFIGHILLAIFSVYVIVVRIWRIQLSRNNWKKHKMSKNFEQITARFKTAIGFIEKELIDENNIKYGYRVANKMDIEDIINLAHHAWDYDESRKQIRNIEERRKYILNLYNINSNIFSVIRKEEENIGYVSVIPMKRMEHFTGFMDQYELTKEDISTGQSDLIYLQAIFVKDTYRNNKLEYATALICLFEQIAKNLNKDKTSLLYAEQFTVDGEKLLLKWGFQRLLRKSKGAHPKPIWSLSMNINHIPENFDRIENAKITVQAINKIYLLKISEENQLN